MTINPSANDDQGGGHGLTRSGHGPAKDMWSKDKTDYDGTMMGTATRMGTRRQGRIIQQ